MAQAPPSSTRNRQSWRDKRQVPHEAVGQSRRLRRWSFSIFGLLLLAALAWQIYNIFRPRTIVALLPVTSYHALIPPVRFGANDCDRLANTGFNTVDLRGFQTFTIFDTIGRTLREQHGLRPKDTLLAYVSAHGVSEDGAAFLLGSKVLEERQSRAELKSFLANLINCDARRTLVFLDAGHLNSDPRQGMIANEFPQILEEAVRATGNANLWVMTSCGMHEFSHVSYQQEQTVFGYFVAEGLSGAADRFGSGNDDGLVDLAELADYVAAGVSQYVQQQAGPGETQSPRLLWGKAGSAEQQRAEAHQVELPRYRDVKVAKQKDEPPPSDKKKTASANSAKTPSPALTWVGAEPSGGRFALLNLQNPPAAAAPAPPDPTKPAQPPAANSPGSSSTPAPPSADAAKPAGDKPADSAPGGAAKDAAAPAAAAAQGTSPAASPTGASANPTTAPPATTPPAAAPAANTTAPSAPPPAAQPAEKSPPVSVEEQKRKRRKMLDRLLLAWQSRDRSIARAGGGFSPVDFAPHIWRQYEETLLSYEARCAAGQAFDIDKLIASLEGDALDELTLTSGAVLPAAKLRLQQDTSRYEDLRQLWSRFDKSAGRRDLETGPDAKVLRSAWELRNDCLYRATDLLRWHARASLAAEQTDLNYAEIASLIEQAAAVDSQLGVVTGPNPSDEQTETLRRRTEQLRGTWQTLAARLLRRSEQLLASPNQSGARRELADLLATPALPAELRMKLLEAQIAGAGERPLNREVHSPPPIAPSPVKAWQRAREQATLEVSLLKLVDGKGAQAAQAPIDGDVSSDKLPEALRRCGARLAQSYQELPGSVESILRSKTPNAARDADLHLRLVDARDALRLSNEQYNPVPLVRWEVKRPQDVDVAVVERLQLDHNGATPLEITLAAPPGYGGEPVVLELRDQGNRLDISLADDRAEGVEPLPANTGFARARVKLSSDRRVAVRYDVRPRTAQIWDANIDVVLTAAGRQSVRRVRGSVPRPQRIDLVVMSGARETADLVRLRPFANRSTTFQLGLAQRTAEDRKVRVQLYALDLPLRTARQIWDDTGKLPDARASIASGEMTLKGGEEPQALAFPPPAAPPAAAPADAKPADGAAPAPAKAPPKKISGTLVCLVQDLADPAARPYATWIDVTVRHPRDYVTPTVRYDRTGKELSIDLKPGDSELLLGRAGDPIAIVWDTAGQIPPGDVLQPETALRAPSFSSRLRARVEPGRDKQVRVKLSVDGYPRAFIYDVPCDLDRDRIPRSDKVQEVAITPHVEVDPKAKPDSAAAPPKPKARMAYAKPLPDRTLNVDVAVDAPDDAFQHYGASGERGQDELKVGIDANRDRLLGEGEVLFTATSDRQIELAISETTPDGGLVIQTKVSDFSIGLTPVELYNKDFDVRAELSLAGSHPSAGEAAAQNSFAAIIDGDPPKFDAISVPRSVEQGAKAKLEFDVVDKTSIDDVFFVVDLDENGRIDENEKPVHARRVKGDETRSAWQAVWNTAEPKELDPGAYILLVRAVDEVKNESLLEQVEIQVTEKKPKSTDPVAAIGSIAGLSRYGQFPLKGKVEIIEGPKKASKAADREGKFQFDKLPPGDYILKAEGGAGNNLNLVGKISVTIPPEGGKIEGVVIELDKAPKPPPIPGVPPPK